MYCIKNNNYKIKLNLKKKIRTVVKSCLYMIQYTIFILSTVVSYCNVTVSQRPAQYSYLLMPHVILALLSILLVSLKLKYPWSLDRAF